MPRITFLLTPGFADWEYAMLAATARSWYGCETHFAVPGGGAVTSAGGLTTADLPAFDPAQAGDALILVGGTAWRAAPPALDLALVPDSTVIGAICDGTRAAATAGLLDRAAHTANDADTLDVEGYGGAARFVQSAAALRDGRIVTAAGTAPVSFMAEVLAALGLADDNLGYYRRLLAAEHAPPAAA